MSKHLLSVAAVAAALTFVPSASGQIYAVTVDNGTGDIYEIHPDAPVPVAVPVATNGRWPSWIDPKSLRAILVQNYRVFTTPACVPTELA